MAEFYISSTKCSIRERKTKRNGRVYDVYFRVVDQEGYEHQRKISGFTTKTAAKEAHAEFITKHCELVKGIKKKKAEERKKAEAEALLFPLVEMYLASLPNQIKESSIVSKESVFRAHILPHFTYSPTSHRKQRCQTSPLRRCTPGRIRYGGCGRRTASSTPSTT